MTNRALFKTLYLVLKILEQLSLALTHICMRETNLNAAKCVAQADRLLQQAFQEIDNAAIKEGSTLREMLQ